LLDEESENPSWLPPATNGGSRRGANPGAKLTTLPHVGHYDFLAECTPAGNAAVPACRPFQVVYPGRRLSGNRTGIELRETNCSSTLVTRTPLTPAWLQLLRVVVHHAGVGPLLDLIDCGDIVEPFLGSGSTLITADKNGRVCRSVEFDRSASM
jgi:hypothetical protein